MDADENLKKLALNYMGCIEDAVKFLILLEKKPKWLLLLLYLRKRYMIGIREAMRMLNMKHSQLRSAIRYLAGLPSHEKGGIYTSSTVTKPFITVEVISPKAKFIAPTTYGLEFAEKVVALLKDVVLAHGRVDFEKEYGVSSLAAKSEIKAQLVAKGMPMQGWDSRIVSWSKAKMVLFKKYPKLLVIMKPELVDAVQVKLTIRGMPIVLYVIS